MVKEMKLKKSKKVMCEEKRNGCTAAYNDNEKAGRKEDKRNKNQKIK